MGDMLWGKLEFYLSGWPMGALATPNAGSRKKCKMERIEIRNEFGGDSQLYEVIGFKLMQDSPNHPEMDCDSMDVR